MCRPYILRYPDVGLQKPKGRRSQHLFKQFLWNHTYYIFSDVLAGRVMKREVCIVSISERFSAEIRAWSGQSRLHIVAMHRLYYWKYDVDKRTVMKI